MALDKLMKATLVISAIDKASKVVNDVTNKSIRSLGNLQKEADRMASASFAMARKSAAVGLAVAAPLAFVTKQAMGFEQEVANLGAIANATEQQMGILRNTALDMGKSTKFTAIEAAQGMTFLAMAGFDTNENIKAIPSVLELAAAANLDLARAADITSNIMGQYSVAAENTSRVTNLLAATATSANANVEQISESFKFIGPTAAALKVPIEQTAAVIGVLGDSGIQGSLAGRAFGTSLTRLADPTKKVAEALRAANVEAFNAAGEFVGITGLVSQLEVGMAGWSDQQRQAALSTIFGAEALQEINILLNKGASELTKYENKLTGTTAAQTMMERQMNTTLGRFTVMKSTLETLSIEIGTTFLPVLIDVMKAVQPIIENIAAWVKANPELTAQIVKGLAIFSAFSLAVSGVSFAFGGVFKSASLIFQVFRMLPIAWQAATTAFLTNPIVLAIVGIIAAVTALIVYWDEFNAWFDRQSQGLKIVISAITVPFVMVAQVIKSIVKAIQGDWRGALSDLFATFVKFNPFVNIAKWIYSLAPEFFNAGANILKSIWEGMKSMVTRPVEVISEVVSNVRDYLPFSPAKVGPLKDIHRIRLIETIAEGMNPKPMVNAMKVATAATALAVTPVVGAAATPNAGSSINPTQTGQVSGVVINYSPTVNFGGEVSQDVQDSFAAQLKQHEFEIAKLVEQAIAKKSRTSF